jgi:hypothetical protein
MAVCYGVDLSRNAKTKQEVFDRIYRIYLDSKNRKNGEGGISSGGVARGGGGEKSRAKNGMNFAAKERKEPKDKKEEVLTGLTG